MAKLNVFFDITIDDSAVGRIVMEVCIFTIIIIRHFYNKLKVSFNF